MQRFPVGDRLVPLFAFRRKRTTADIVDRRIVDRHHTGTCACLDRHVAQCHAAFHRQGANRGPGEFDGIARSARCTDFSDHGQYDILGRHPVLQRAVHFHQHGFRFFRKQSLRRQHMFHFRRTDTVCQTTERAMRRSMRIATNDRHAGQRRTLFRADDMHDPLPFVRHIEVGQAVRFRIHIQRFHLKTRNGVGDRPLAVLRRYVMVGHQQVGGNSPWLASRHSQTFESLRAGHFVQEMTVDIQNRRAVLFRIHHMGFPKFVIESLCHDAKSHFLLTNFLLCHIRRQT